MTASVSVIGVDPGPTPGLVMLRYTEKASGGFGVPEVTVVQCSAGVASLCLTNLLKLAGDSLVGIQAERFVVRSRAGRSGSAAAGERTRRLLGELFAAVPLHQSKYWHERAASDVKAWATDHRLVKARATSDSTLYTATAGMRHARDAARHALFAAVHDGGIPDPLSKRNAS